MKMKKSKAHKSTNKKKFQNFKSNVNQIEIVKFKESEIDINLREKDVKPRDREEIVRQPEEKPSRGEMKKNESGLRRLQEKEKK
jgi:hypothetical protein